MVEKIGWLPPNDAIPEDSVVVSLSGPSCRKITNSPLIIIDNKHRK
jgi:hypothetical protein